MKDAAELNIKANINAFVLDGNVTEDHPAIESLRQYARTQDNSILDMLISQGVLHEHYEKHNLVTTRGRNVLARLVTGDTTYTGLINYGALGSSSTAVANGDTQLGTEVYRKIFASHASDGNNVAYVDFFFTAAETSGTYQEWGNFVDGTATVNTGRIFSHMLTGGWVKSAAQTLFVSCQYTFS